MKNQLILSIFFMLACAFVQAQPAPTLRTSGRYLLGNCGDTLVLKGVNYAPYNWGYNSNQLRIDQIALSGANAVRLPWYASGNPALYANPVYLDSAISKCIQADMIPIVELHDQTCANTPGNLVELAQYYTQPAVLAIIQKHKGSLIVNVANEALYVNWTSNPQQALQTYRDTYNSIVQMLRTAGIETPIMIDAPDCGMNIDVFASVGSYLKAQDPLQNLIFSAHSYWYAFANNDSSAYLSKINNAMTSNLPLVFGEIANLQDDQQLCQYSLNYRPLLSILETKKIGWLAWSWDNDGCAQRQVTTNGNYSSLTAYGNVVLNNPVYGIKPTAKRSKYLLNPTCITSAISEPDAWKAGLSLKQNETEISLESLDNQAIEITLFNLMGQNLAQTILAPQQTQNLAIQQFPHGLYFLQIQLNQQTFIHKLLF